MAQKMQHFINHVSLVVDRSDSMGGQPVVQVFDKNLEYLKKRSVELNQETRISIYLFNASVECLVFDQDVMRFSSLQGHYQTSGMTALIDAVHKSVEDNKKLPELYGDHAFLQYVITDGEENRSNRRADELSKLLGTLPDNWTTVCMVPNKRGAAEAQRFGFNGGCISIWDTSAKDAFEKVGTTFTRSMDSYMDMRSRGIRGSKSLFTLNTDNVSVSKLQEVDPQLYEVYPVRSEGPIKEFVESWTNKKYRLGSTYYQPTKAVEIQDHKTILVQNIKDGKVYAGRDLRSLLGIPDKTVTVDPGQHRDWRIFVQSTSVNRKLFDGTFVLVMT